MSKRSQTDDISQWDARKPHNGLPDLPPALDVETHSILKACIEGRVALARLKEACRLIPNPTILINIIPVLEAQASSEIENIVTTTDALFRYAETEERFSDPATKETLRYRQALKQGFDELRDRPLSASTAERICSRIKSVDMQIRKIPGTTLINSASGEVIYTPPLGEDLLRSKLANWESFIHGHQEIDPLIRMAIAHYQFEAIHPFVDGNGRTGRILNLLMLVEQGLLDQPVLYLSRYIIRHRADYYQLLNSVTSKSEWEPWIQFMLEAVAQTATWTTEKIHAIQKLHELTKEYLRQAVPKIYSHELLDIIFTQPYSRIQNLVSEGLTERQTASTHLKALTRINVLKEMSLGRAKVFIHPKLMTLLTSEENTLTPYPSPRVPEVVGLEQGT